MLNAEEKSYYSRQLLVDEIGLDGQEKLKNAKVLVIGSGGLGCPLLQYISGAGVGLIGIVDGDIVDDSNLHRQILFDSNSIGKNKANEAKLKLEKLNPFISVTSYPDSLSIDNAEILIQQYDYIVDCTDNYSTRFLINDTCVLLDKPLIYGSIYRFEGQVSVFNYKNGPTYRCLVPEMPKENSIANCSESGVIGVLPGMIGVLQATELIKLITGIGTPLSGKIVVYNALKCVFDFYDLKRNSKIQYQEDLKRNGLKVEQQSHCEVFKNTVIREVEHSFIGNENTDNLVFVDVRESGEQPFFDGPQILKIPMTFLQEKVLEIPKNKTVIVYCKSGVRSKKAIQILQTEHGFTNLFNLTNGITIEFIEAWKKKKSR